MKYLVVLFWSIVMGAILGFIVSSLNGQAFDLGNVVVISMVIGLLAAVLIPAISKTKQK